jgi:hypothetical protein
MTKVAKSALVVVCAAVAVLALARVAWAADCGSGCPAIKNPSPAADSTTSDATPEIAATVRDRQTDLGKKHIKMFVDGARTTTFSYDRATDRLSYTPAAALAEGGHSVKVVARDKAGNVEREKWGFTVSSPPPPEALEASPSSVDFGVHCSEPRSRDVTLQNNAAESATIVPGISGSDASSFSVPADPITLGSGDTAVVRVTFTPSGPWGPRAGSLDLKDPSGATLLAVPLNGTVKCGVDG